MIQKEMKKFDYEITNCSDYKALLNRFEQKLKIRNKSYSSYLDEIEALLNNKIQFL